MSQNDVPDFAALLRSAERSAAHLEMRDVYAVGDEAEDFARFRRTGVHPDLDPDSAGWSGWVPLVRETVTRGVQMRRARIVSEPVTDYIRFEHAGTAVNLAAGEQVRWLPRRMASDIALPGNDLWLIDERLVLFHWFTGDGDWAGHEFNEDPAVVKMVTAAFETVWERAVPHEHFAV
ncbi:DUF6879 family protein [Streptomyces roseochromogenus]|uniref:DUF6879 domain-containing protein n=1 Tax=Streptomyces roseochromogenus subsp. oscitans DS 12.976 TaxID=1352936 RepID=V6KHN8_STRRC|nr:DUF6879 family protein [Streptomyces roseochromogenus]EST31597.1 hypothetical protein M878_16315 [Streptomyces roseochromogenus subsp. oscitans DS 12.976]